MLIAVFREDVISQLVDSLKGWSMKASFSWNGMTGADDLADGCLIA